MNLTRETMKWFKVDEYEPPVGEHVVVAITGVGRFSGWGEAVYAAKGKFWGMGANHGDPFLCGITHFMIPANPLVQNLE